MTALLFTPEQDQLIAALYRDGLSIRKIARKLHAGFGTVQRALYRSCATLRSYSEARREYRLNEAAFADAEHSEPAAYFVGLLMADGCVTQRKYGWRVTLGLSNGDGVMVDEFARFIETNHPVYAASYRNKIGWNSGPSRRITIDSTPLVKSLMRYGVMPRKSLTAEVIGLENNRHFWRGMIDGDGFVYVARNGTSVQPVIGLVGSRATTEQFSRFMHSHSECASSANPMRSIWRAETKGRPAVQMIRLLYGDCTIAMPRKRAVADGIMTDFLESGRHRDAPIKSDHTWMTAEFLLPLRAKLGSWLQVAHALDIKPMSMYAVKRRLGLT